MTIPVLRPLLPRFESAAKYLRLIDSTRIYSNGGPNVKELESRFAKKFGVDAERVVAFANATLAIQGSVSILPPKEWVVPNFTFAATGLAVLGANQSLFLSDVSEADWQLKPCLDDLYPNQAQGVGYLPVMPFGAPVPINKWRHFQHVVFDAAASLGSNSNLTSLEPGWIAVFSLHATKILGSGEGAIAIAGSLSVAKQLRQWLNFGFNSSRTSEFEGTNAKLSEFNAAYGLASLDQEEIEINEWNSVLNEIRVKTENLKMSKRVPEFKGVKPYWIIRATSAQSRSKLINLLDSNGIGHRIWWGAELSSHPAFKFCKRQDSLDMSRDLAATHLGLPCYRDLTSEEIVKISDLLYEFERNEP
jgi:dTDP-4-amino-4,6-dideoxygalactose transaminase